MADGPVVNGGLLASAPPRQGFDQVILKDLGDIGRAVSRQLGFRDTPNPDRTPAETPGPSPQLAAAAIAAAAAAAANQLPSSNPAATPTPEQLANGQLLAALLHITPTWQADP